MGDPNQAIYAFRGASPESLSIIQTVFDCKRYDLSCCFRCPQRVVFLASQMEPDIRATQNAILGKISLVSTENPWKKILLLTQKNDSAIEKNLLLIRDNKTILDFLHYVYEQNRMTPVTLQCTIRWVAPTIANQLKELFAMSLEKLDDIRAILTSETSDNEDTTAVMQMDNTILLCMIDQAIRLEGKDNEITSSQYLLFLTECLTSKFESDQGHEKTYAMQNHHHQLTVSTIHAAKGQEFDHVYIHDYNLYGHRHRQLNSEFIQEKNLLYIAITRAIQSISFIKSKRNEFLPSPFLTDDIIYLTQETDHFINKN